MDSELPPTETTANTGAGTSNWTGGDAAGAQPASSGRGERRQWSKSEIKKLIETKRKLKRKLDKLSRGEEGLESADDYIVMGKCEAKLLKIEKALYDANIYDDATADPENSTLLPITVVISGFQPLNDLLSAFVNNMDNAERFDKLLGFKHVYGADVEEMMGQLIAEGHQHAINHLFHGDSKEHVCERIADKTNKWCRQVRNGSAENIVNFDEWIECIKEENGAHGYYDADPEEVIFPGRDIGGNAAPPAIVQRRNNLVEELIRLERIGEIEAEEEPDGAVDLDERGGIEADEREGEEEPTGDNVADARDDISDVVANGTEEHIEDQQALPPPEINGIAAPDNSAETEADIDPDDVEIETLLNKSGDERNDENIDDGQVERLADEYDVVELSDDSSSGGEDDDVQCLS